MDVKNALNVCTYVRLPKIRINNIIVREGYDLTLTLLIKTLSKMLNSCRLDIGSIKITIAAVIKRLKTSVRKYCKKQKMYLAISLMLA